MASFLPNLQTRESIQDYLLGLAKEMGVSLDDVQFAAELDKRDKLAGFRNKFHIPTIGGVCEEDKRAKGVVASMDCIVSAIFFSLHFVGVDPSHECIYMCGNSLGLQPKGGMELVQVEMEKWAKKGLRGHFEGQFPWYPIEDFIVADIAKIVGANPIEVAVMNSLTVNCHLGMVSSNA